MFRPLPPAPLWGGPGWPGTAILLSCHQNDPLPYCYSPSVGCRKRGDGGELVLHPSLTKKVIIEPKLDRLVLFSGAASAGNHLDARHMNRLCLSVSLPPSPSARVSRLCELSFSARDAPPSPPQLRGEALLYRLDVRPTHSHRCRGCARDCFCAYRKSVLEHCTSQEHRSAGVLRFAPVSCRAVEASRRHRGGDGRRGG